MAECDDVTRRALVQLNMHCIAKEMIASHVLIYMPSMAGKKV